MNTRADELLHLEDLQIGGKTLLIRQDLNVPMKDGCISNDARLKAALPTLTLALSKGAKVILASHLGRPKEGIFEETFSLAPIANYLSEALGRSVPLITTWDENFKPTSTLSLLENVRFNPGEKANDKALAKKMARLCNIFVMDAFGTAHRAHASTEGVARFAPLSCAGPLLSSELKALSKALFKPKKPLVAIVGGAKVSSKLDVLTKLAEQVDHLIVGGGIANTFIAAKGFNVGKSLYEPDLIKTAKAIMEKVHIPVPEDVVTASQCSEDANTCIKRLADIAAKDMILDLGPASTKVITQIVHNAGTLVWNGPLGVFELTPFSRGTETLAKAIAQSPGFSIAGGGDTLAAIDKFQVTDHLGYISTGGGAFLEYLEGKTLPAVAALIKSTKAPEQAV